MELTAVILPIKLVALLLSLWLQKLKYIVQMQEILDVLSQLKGNQRICQTIISLICLLKREEWSALVEL